MFLLLILVQISLYNFLYPKHLNYSTKGRHKNDINNVLPKLIVYLTLSANRPVHPCAPAKGSAHAYTQNCARIHRGSPEDMHARAQHCTHLYNYFLTCMNNDSEPK